MVSSRFEKEQIKHDLASVLSGQREVCRIIIFGSFLTDSSPRDVDVAIFQDSSEPYLPLALKYRRLTRDIASQIPLDIIPLRAGDRTGAFLAEVERGEVIYER